MTEEQQSAFLKLKACMAAQDGALRALLGDLQNLELRTAWMARRVELDAACREFERVHGI